MRRLRGQRGGQRNTDAAGVEAEADHIRVKRTDIVGPGAQTDITRAHGTIEAGRGALLRIGLGTRIVRTGSIDEHGHLVIRGLDQGRRSVPIADKVLRL